MANKFCKLLSNCYKINVEGEKLLWSPCCFYTKKTPLMDKAAFEKEIAYTSAATGWIPECRTCKRMEQSGAPGLAPRLNAAKKFSEDFEDGVCAVLEISFDTKCNAACLSCGPYCSTTWEKYERKHTGQTRLTPVDAPNELFQQLIDTVPMDKVRDIFVMGGEPLYSKTNIKMLEHLYRVHPEPEKICLSYQTNGSIYPTEEVQQYWSGFRRVVMNLSIDGVGERFNYLRYPLKWHKVERNVKQLIENTNVIFNFNVTVNPLSVLYFDEVEKWVYDTIPEERRINKNNCVRANRCCPPLDLNLSTTELRERVIEKYGPEHQLSKIYSNLEFNNDHQSLIDYVELHDYRRRLDWKKTFPDAVEFYGEFSKMANIYKQFYLQAN